MSVIREVVSSNLVTMNSNYLSAVPSTIANKYHAERLKAKQEPE